MAFVRSLQFGGAPKTRPKLTASSEWPLQGDDFVTPSGKFWPVTAGGRPIRRRLSLIDPELPVGVPDSGRWRNSKRTLSGSKREQRRASFHKVG
jgi:hypothetical protein